MPKLLQLLMQLTEYNDRYPIAIMSYKSRDEYIDDNLFTEFDNNSIDGEQANGRELDEEFLQEPIDIFILYLKDKATTITIPS
jgi:hypothetical protein